MLHIVRFAIVGFIYGCNKFLSLPLSERCHSLTIVVIVATTC